MPPRLAHHGNPRGHGDCAPGTLVLVSLATEITFGMVVNAPLAARSPESEHANSEGQLSMLGRLVKRGTA